MKYKVLLTYTPLADELSMVKEEALFESDTADVRELFRAGVLALGRDPAQLLLGVSLWDASMDDAYLNWAADIGDYELEIFQP